MPEMKVRGRQPGAREALEGLATGEMRIMGREGDTKVIWNARDTDEVEAARQQFNTLRERNFLAFRVDDSGSKGEQITEFDPQVQKLIMAPPMAGGAGTMCPDCRGSGELRGAKCLRCKGTGTVDATE